MPKPTFLQLPDAKRDRVVQASLYEFTEHGYDLASICRLVAGLGIAKGSIYQYFGDKYALFEYLLQESGRRKLAAVMPTHAHTADVFERLRGMYGSGLAFWQEHPRWAAVALRALEPSREPRMVALRAQLTSGAHGFVRGLLEEGQEQGHVRRDVNLDTVTHLVTAMLQHGLRDAFMARLGLAPGELPDGPVDLGDMVIADIVDDAVGLLQWGLGPSARGD